MQLFGDVSKSIDIEDDLVRDARVLYYSFVRARQCFASMYKINAVQVRILQRLSRDNGEIGLPYRVWYMRQITIIVRIYFCAQCSTFESPTGFHLFDALHAFRRDDGMIQDHQ